MDLFNIKKLKEQEKQIKELSLMINDKNSEINRQHNSINHLENNQSRILSENQKLIDWIMKILDAAGTIEVRERSNFKIPIYERKEYNPVKRNIMGIFEREVITIPEITITRLS